MKNPQSVISQIRLAAQPGNRLAALLGACIGAVPPVGSYAVVHGALDARPLWAQPLAYLVAGLMVFSGLSVVRWMRAAFRLDGRLATAKAVGWTVGIEGILVGTPAGLEWLALVCVGYLVAINAISAASGFVADFAAEKADRRAAARAPLGAPKARAGTKALRRAA